MKSILTKLAATVLACTLLAFLPSCGDNGDAANTTEPAEVTQSTENTTEPAEGTVYYPPGQEPVERPHPKG